MKYKQIIPCNEKMYAVVRDNTTGQLVRVKVMAFSLASDGCVYPLVFSPEFGIKQPPVDQLPNFIGYVLEDGDKILCPTGRGTE